MIAEIPYGEEIMPYDLDGDGRLDVVAGPYWLENQGNGQFKSHLLAGGIYKSRTDRRGRHQRRRQAGHCPG